MIPNLTAVATAPPGGINLGKYPGLVHAPEQHGPGIRFAHNGKPVDLLVPTRENYFIEGHDIGVLDETASALGVSFADVCDALKFLRDQGAI